jgi:hypothetical protein
LQVALLGSVACGGHAALAATLEEEPEPEVMASGSGDQKGGRLRGDGERLPEGG